MKYPICISLLVCFVLFQDDINAEFTRDTCVACCNGLSDNSHDCVCACHQRFGRRQEYNSRNDCIRSCVAKLYGCRQACIDDCGERFEYFEPGAKIPTRAEKERRKIRKATEFLGLPVYKTTPRAPDKPKRFRRSKQALEEGSSGFDESD